MEHVYPLGALAGRYVFEITADIETEYALAWRMATAVHIPSLLAIAADTGGTARITVDGLANQPYALDYAAEPALSWIPLYTNTPASAPFDLFDPGAGSAGHRTYRVRAVGLP